MSGVMRVYIEKKPEYDVSAQKIKSDLKQNLMGSEFPLVEKLSDVRVFLRYDVEGVSPEIFERAKNIIFAEAPVDIVYDNLPFIHGAYIFAVESLPGQFDQRADFSAQCIQLLTQSERPKVRTAWIYALTGDLSGGDITKIKSYMINPVECRETSLELPETLEEKYASPNTVETCVGFINLDNTGLTAILDEYKLAMDTDDLLCLQDYFKNTEKRDPTITEIRMLDAYWSDHCRHTTFGTIIDNVDIEPEYIGGIYNNYLSIKASEKPVTLMSLATIGMKHIKKLGLLEDLDESEEVNACSIKIKVDKTVDGFTSIEDWLLMFKNETHNHPTEIEPFGGASTCLGGAIRDPLSGRSYVYHAMRITGAADPRTSIADTIEGKLPQRKLTTTAAAGYSSYGNQIGLTAGLVREFYHPGFAAKRMELGAVVGAAPMDNVVREEPKPGDIVVLLGGRTGRDGIGGAAGSSKSHTVDSMSECGAEVQKGNPPIERNIQRLFRKSEISKLIKRCNDFGAGGVSVAIGELADGLRINLDAVPTKYPGLDGTEIAISESQERMAVVISSSDKEKFIAAAQYENLEATEVAVVTESPRLVMEWKGNVIVDLSREFLNSNGAEKHADIKIKSPDLSTLYKNDLNSNWLEAVADINICSQKGLIERFDSTANAGTVLMPLGGKEQLSPQYVMAAKIPVLDGDTKTCSVMSYGYDPYLSEKSPFHGAAAAVIESITRLVASGCDFRKCRLSFQEYFPRVKDDSERWGKPFAALLGAISVQLGLNIPSIGGKDSMSGTFESLDVPPTLASFAICANSIDNLISTEFKKAGSKVIMLQPEYDENGIINFSSLTQIYSAVYELISERKVYAGYALGAGGLVQAITEMCAGNNIGFEFNINEYMDKSYGTIILEVSPDTDCALAKTIGMTREMPVIKTLKETIKISDIYEKWLTPLENVFGRGESCLPVTEQGTTKKSEYSNTVSPYAGTSKPKVLIPVFPGTNCEYEIQKQFVLAGADTEIFVAKMLTPAMIKETAERFVAVIKESQIIAIPGGFSAGDETIGSDKFISVLFRNPCVSEAVMNLLNQKDGLILGIGSSFKALLNLGLLPYGKIITDGITDKTPTLTFNSTGKYQSGMFRTIVTSVKSPWMSLSKIGDIHVVPVSGSEGRFVAHDSVISEMKNAGQIATQYADSRTVEGITSPDGRVFGKSAHSERLMDGLYKNISGVTETTIFRAGVNYFKL